MDRVIEILEEYRDCREEQDGVRVVAEIKEILREILGEELAEERRKEIVARAD